MLNGKLKKKLTFAELATEFLLSQQMQNSFQVMLKVCMRLAVGRQVLHCQVSKALILCRSGTLRLHEKKQS